jgi:hypothetical protein
VGRGGARLVGAGIEVVDREVVDDPAGGRDGSERQRDHARREPVSRKPGRPAPARGHRRGPVWVGDSSLISGECHVTRRRWHRPRPLPVSAPAAVTAAVTAVIVPVEAPVERVVAVVGIYRTGRGVVELNIARRLALAA